MAKGICENSHALSIFYLRKHGYLCNWSSGWIKWTSAWGDESSVNFTVDTTGVRPHIRFNYTQTTSGGQKTDMDYRVELTTTRCNLGSKRYWFICPLNQSGVPCQRRVGVIYLAGRYFGCRNCYDLTYNSQQESRGGGMLGVYGLLLDLEAKIERAEAKVRVRYWRGWPTKRYARILRKIEVLERYDSLFLPPTDPLP